MNTAHIAKELRTAIDELKLEREQIDNRISAMEQALRGLGVKRGPGRPKGSGKKAAPAATTGSPAPSRRKKVTRNWSPEARRAAAERMRKYWADRKKASKKA